MRMLAPRPARRRFFRSVSILLALLMRPPAGALGAAQIDRTPRLAIISAYKPELSPLKSRMSVTRTTIIADTTYILGKLEGKDVVLFLSGVSMVNAAMTTQGAIDHFRITGIVFSGIAGGVNPSLSPGDVVVADRWSEFLESVFARQTATGWSVPNWLGKTQPNYGMIFPYAVGIAHPDQNEPEKRFWFEVDPAMVPEIHRDCWRWPHKLAAIFCLSHPNGRLIQWQHSPPGLRASIRGPLPASENAEQPPEDRWRHHQPRYHE